MENDKVINLLEITTFQELAQVMERWGKRYDLVNALFTPKATGLAISLMKRLIHSGRLYKELRGNDSILFGRTFYTGQAKWDRIFDRK